MFIARLCHGGLETVLKPKNEFEIFENLFKKRKLFRRALDRKPRRSEAASRALSIRLLDYLLDRNSSPFSSAIY